MSSSTSVSYFCRKICSRKFGFASFVEHFEAVPCLLPANCSLPLLHHFLEYLNYFEYRDLEDEIEGITVVLSTDIYKIFSFSLQVSHSFVHLIPTWNRSSYFVTSIELPFLTQMGNFLLSIVFNLILLSLFIKLITVLIMNIYIYVCVLFEVTSRRVTVLFPYIMSTLSVLVLYVKLSELPMTRYGNVWGQPICQLETRMSGYPQQMNSTRG